MNKHEIMKEGASNKPSSVFKLAYAKHGTKVRPVSQQPEYRLLCRST